MTKNIIKWEKDGFILQSFQVGFAEKYYEDCFTKPSVEIDRLTGSSGTYKKEVVFIDFLIKTIYNCRC